MEQWILLSFLILCFFEALCLVAYSPRLFGWFAALKKDKHLVNPKANRIAVLVPARNESATIEGLLKALKNQTYSNFEVFVIVKEKNDPSIAIVHRYGYHVHLAAAQTCKGDALDSCLHAIMRHDQQGFDAYLIIDADCGLESNYIEEMNNALASGAQIIQGKKLVKNYHMSKKISLQQACNGIIWTLMDDMGNRWKSRHGYVNFTVGTGIMLRKDIVEINDGWPYRSTLTEDVEFMNDIAANGYSTFYYGYAKLYMEEAPSLSMTNKRRKRWMTGVVDARRLYNTKVNSMASVSNRYFAHCLWIIYYYIGAATIYSVVMFLASVGLTAFGFYGPAAYAFAASIGAFLIVYLSYFVMTLFAIIIDWTNMPMNFFKKMAVLFLHPLFYMDYTRIVAGALLHMNSQNWDVIARVEEDPETKKA
jgi:cellulose synthase/poly-beta-1,6-N-acetylglucosamine synthase-like glycosyltransferase